MTIGSDTITSFQTSSDHSVWQDTGLSYTIPAGEGGDWVILFGCPGVHDVNNAGAYPQLRVLHESTEIAFHETVDNYMDHEIPCGFAGVRNCSAGDVIKVQIRNVLNWGPAAIPDDAYLVCFTKPSGAESDSDHVASEQSYNTDTSWQDVSQITVTPSGTKDIIVMGGISFKGNNNSNAVKVRLYDSTNTKEVKNSVALSSYYRAAGYAYRVNTSSATTFKLQVSTSNTGTTVNYKNSFLVGFTEDDVGDYNDNYSASGNTSSSSLQDAASMTWTPDEATDYCFVSFLCQYNSGTNWYDSTKHEVVKDSTGIWGSGLEANPAWDTQYYTHFLPMAESAAASSRTDKNQYCINSGGTSYYYDAIILAFKEAAAGGNQESVAGSLSWAGAITKKLFAKRNPAGVL